MNTSFAYPEPSVPQQAAGYSTLFWVVAPSGKKVPEHLREGIAERLDVRNPVLSASIHPLILGEDDGIANL